MGELRHHAVSLPTSTGWSNSIRRTPAKRAMIDSAMFYLIGTLYPYVARATYPALGFPQYAGEVGHSDARCRDKERGAQGGGRSDRRAAGGVPQILSWTASRSSAATNPSIADIRLAATLEFLAVIDYPLPDWARTYMAAWRRRSARPIRSRPPTCAAISTTSDPAAPEPIGKLLRSGCSPGRAVRAGTIEAPLQVR